jgi:glycosyltransferase involved in cell wall biosynthesis
MRIAVSAPIVEPKPSGVGVYSINLVNEMAKLCPDFRLYTSYPDAFDVDPLVIRGISPRTRPEQGRKGFINRILWLQTLLSLRTLYNRDSVIFHTGSEGSLIPIVPQVVTVHDVIPILFPELHPHPIEVVFFRNILPRMLRRCAAIIAVSESTKRDIVRLYNLPPERIHVIYEGFDRDIFRPQQDAQAVKQELGLDRYIHYSGNVLPHKNVARLVEAFGLIADKIPHKLVLQGRRNPEFADLLDGMIQERGLEERVVFPGYIPLEHLPQLYGGADVFTFVSLSEGFGLPPLEAMACGTPVIASNTSSLPEVVGDAGILVNPVSPEEIAEAILHVVNDAELRAELSQKALERAATFSWAKAARETLDVLQSVAKGR